MRPALSAFKRRMGSQIVNALEVGVAAGQHAQDIHDNLRCRNLVLVDNWHSQYRSIVFKWLEDTCRRFEDDKRVTIIKASSLDAWRFLERMRFNFIYIDDSHAYGHVLQELKIYGRFQREGDMIAGHDYDPESPDRVMKAVDEWAAMNCLKVNHKELDWWVWR